MPSDHCDGVGIGLEKGREGGSRKDEETRKLMHFLGRTWKYIIRQFVRCSEQNWILFKKAAAT